MFSIFDQIHQLVWNTHIKYLSKEMLDLLKIINLRGLRHVNEELLENII